MWVLVDGYDWWPARVISEEELRESTGAGLTSGCDVAVVFYKGTATEASIYELDHRAQADHICYFENSSEKAVTNSEDLKAAIQNAMEDASANPLKTASAKIVAGAGSTADRRMETRAMKRGRDHAVAASSEAPAASGSKSYTRLSTEKLKILASQINDAVEQGDVPALRILLCELDNVDVYPLDLECTKIGVAVGNILGKQACHMLWPLSRALVSCWARHLPPETVAAIKRLQEAARRKKEIIEPGSPMLASPTLAPHSLALQLPKPSFSSPTTRREASSPTLGLAPSSPTAHTGRQKGRFHATVYRLLDDPTADFHAPVETIEEVAKSLAEEVVSQDDRVLLVQRLGNPELGYVRKNLLTKKWTVKQYLEQVPDTFKTKREKDEEEVRLREKIAAEESAKMANVNVTSLFICPNCQKNKCHFYEQQTRSADEPTTKFITCLECKTTWTQE